MTETTVQLPTNRSPTRVGQATVVEQSRAIAEVQAAVIVAQQNPRQTQYALQSMRDACANPRLASKAFFAFPRGGERVAGASIHLARELARIWGNITYGVAEMVRDDDHGQSEMQAYAWDLETNTRVGTGFIVPHKRDTKKGVKALTDMRDIYENNANNGARRVRENIFAVLPTWLTDEAQEICAKTNEDGGGLPLPQRTANSLTHWAAANVTEKQLEDRLGRSSSRWTGQDLAQLATLYASLQRGEVRREDEFPTTNAVTAADIRGPEPVPAEPAGDPEKDRRRLFAILGELGVKEREDRLAVYSAIVGRPVASTDELDPTEVQGVADTLDGVTRYDAEHRVEEVGGLIVEGKKIRSGGQS